MGIFKDIFAKVFLKEKVDEDLEMVRYAIKHNVAIIVGSQIPYNKMRGINRGITVLRINQNFTFEVKGAKIDKAILHHTVSQESRDWIVANTRIEIVEMEK